MRYINSQITYLLTYVPCPVVVQVQYVAYYKLAQVLFVLLVFIRFSRYSF